VGLLCFAVLLISLAGFSISLQAFYWGSEIAVPSVAALAPENSKKIAQVILTNVYPPGNVELVRTMAESEQSYAALLHKGLVEQVNANQKRSLLHLALWSATLVASALAVGALLPRRNRKPQ
jgi:hypothetical protein